MALYKIWLLLLVTLVLLRKTPVDLSSQGCCENCQPYDGIVWYQILKASLKLAALAWPERRLPYQNEIPLPFPSPPFPAFLKFPHAFLYLRLTSLPCLFSSIPSLLPFRPSPSSPLLSLILLFENTIAKFPWGRLGGIAFTTIWPWGDRPHPPTESAPMPAWTHVDQSISNQRSYGIRFAVVCTSSIFRSSLDLPVGLQVFWYDRLHRLPALCVLCHLHACSTIRYVNA